MLKTKKETVSHYAGQVVLDGPAVDFSNKKLRSLEGKLATDPDLKEHPAFKPKPQKSPHEQKRHDSHSPKRGKSPDKGPGGAQKDEVRGDEHPDNLAGGSDGESDPKAADEQPTGQKTQSPAKD